MTSSKPVVAFDIDEFVFVKGIYDVAKLAATSADELKAVKDWALIFDIHLGMQVAEILILGS